ncbi:hypothetical protein [Ferruginibacter sp.]|uniref:hypothetical protein n=1 Tax=Ferruginibacter sp. TaxID=1940288 RepID=UPI00265AA769|nr:hypothetical protein [Ferruginibacter sp.]
MKIDKADEGMSSDMLELVLRELLAEQETSRLVVQQSATVLELKTSIKNLDEHLTSFKTAPAQVSTNDRRNREKRCRRDKGDSG